MSSRRECGDVNGWAVIPAIRVRDMGVALDFYQNMLGFSLDRGGPSEDNCSLSRGGAKIMLETPADFYSTAYNTAIESRLGSPSAIALYIEEPDLEDLHRRLVDAGVVIVDPPADRPWGQAEFTIEDAEG